MKSKVVVGIIFCCLFVTCGFGDPLTQIRYETSDLGSGQWEYTYDVINLSLSVPIEEFSIWYDFGLYNQVNVETDGAEVVNITLI